jgi:hypothetical protein
LGSLSELAHFIGNNGKTSSMFACTRCFNSGIQRKKIGLFRDICVG